MSYFDYEPGYFLDDCEMYDDDDDFIDADGYGKDGYFYGEADDGRSDQERD